MKKRMLTAVVLAAVIVMAGCGKTEKKTEKVNNEPAVTEAEESRPEGEFEKLPDEALEAFDSLTVELKDIFPDTKGKLMYGYTGEQLIDTESGEKDCYIFDYYTYKKKVYTKIATVAMDKESKMVYLFDEADGTFSEAETEQNEEKKWCETATPALAAAVSDKELSE